MSSVPSVFPLINKMHFICSKVSKLIFFPLYEIFLDKMSPHKSSLICTVDTMSGHETSCIYEMSQLSRNEQTDDGSSHLI